MAKSLTLPNWATKADSVLVDKKKVSIVINADCSVAYPEWLALLASDEYASKTTPKLANASSPDKYWVEVAYQCIKLDLQAAIAGTEFDPTVTGIPAEFHLSNCPEFALANFPDGKGTAAATQGKEARAHYKRIRGSLPF